jgi:G:T-mismatch repair DNA endonuclease (very short patch repair protein)
LRVPFFHNAGNSDFSASRQCPELWLIAIFRANGITGWRRHQPVFGKPDFVFPKQRLAVFVDGPPSHEATARQAASGMAARDTR